MSESLSVTSPKRIAVVDGIRGLACISIIFAHGFGFVLTAKYYHPLSELYGSLYFPISNANHAIAVFFIISGFVLYLPFGSGRRTMLSRKDAFEYVKRRAWRLLPLYYISGLFFYVYFSHLPFSIWEIMKYFGFLFPFAERKYPIFNGPLWTLGLEWWYSLMVPLFILGSRWFGLQRFLVFSILFSLASRIIGLWIHGTPISFFSMNTIVGRVDEFIIGMALGWAYAIGENIRLREVLCSLVILLSAAIITPLYHHQYASPYGFAILYSAVSTSFAVLFYGILKGCMPMLSGIIQSKLPVYCGKMCYSLYVLHIPVFTITGLFTSPKRTVYSLVMLGIVSTLTFLFIEQFTNTRKLLSLYFSWATRRMKASDTMQK